MSPRGPPIATRYACVHLSEGACVHLCACVRKRVDIFMYAVVYDLMDARYLHASVYAHACLHACVHVCIRRIHAHIHEHACLPIWPIHAFTYVLTSRSSSWPMAKPVCLNVCVCVCTFVHMLASS